MTVALLGYACGTAAAAVRIEGQVQLGGGPLTVELVNFSQLMNARWLRRLSDLIQRHRTSLKYHHRLGLFPETA